ncbi:MAG: glutaredoxin family protein [Gammaproteobacteria bacterium]
MPSSQKRREWSKTIVLIGLFLVALNWQSVFDRLRGAVAYDAALAGPVVVFSTEWCGYCKKTKHFLNTHDIPYDERDIEQSDAAREAFTRLGGNGVPLVLVGNQIIHGYSLGKLRTALECQNCAGQTATDGR